MDTEKGTDGKVKRKMVYVGPYYLWSTKKDVLNKLRCSCLFTLLAEWFLFLGSLCFYNTISRNWYVILPYACLILALFYKSMAVFNLYKVTEPMNREMKDKTSERIKGASLCSIILIAAALLGEGVACFREIKLLKVTDYVFVAVTIVLFLLILYDFRAVKQLQVTEQENPVAAEWKNK